MIEVTHHWFYTKRMVVMEPTTVQTHSHQSDHVSRLVIGSAEVTVDGVTTRYDAPASVHIAAHKHHTIRALTPMVWDCIHEIPPDLVDDEARKYVDERLVD